MRCKSLLDRICYEFCHGIGCGIVFHLDNTFMLILILCHVLKNLMRFLVCLFFRHGTVSAHPCQQLWLLKVDKFAIWTVERDGTAVCHLVEGTAADAHKQGSFFKGKHFFAYANQIFQHTDALNEIVNLLLGRYVLGVIFISYHNIY